MLRISVFGLGYVGCVTAACLAKAGHEVIGVEPNREKVTMLNAGESPIIEPGLRALLVDVVGVGRLRATHSADEAVSGTDIAFICVGTPSGPSGQIDVEALIRVGEEIGKALAGRRRPFTVVLRSTVLPGTLKRVLVPALDAGAGGRLGGEVRVAVHPEFMREGSALRDFAAPPLTVVGCDERETARLIESLYPDVEAPFVHTSVKTAEMLKYAANAFHALKVCFANEIGDACRAFGVDEQEVMQIFCMDRKLNVSEAYLRPGFAFGGSCLPKDVRALLHAVQHADVALPLIASILPSNEAQIRHAVETVLAAGKRSIGVVGLAFKRGTDDLRESPMVTLVEALIGKGCSVRILDRSASIARLTGANRRYIENEIPHIASLMCDDVEELIEHAQVIVLGSDGHAAVEVLDQVRPEQTVVDLTRGTARRSTRRGRSETAAASVRP